MARKSADGVNRSQLIRDYKKGNKKMGPKAIAEAMQKDHGVDISPQYVSTVLSTAKRKGGKIGRPGRRPAGAEGAVALDSAKLLKAKEFINLMGTAADAKAAITLIERLL